MVLYESFHSINVDGGQSNRRDIPTDFLTFINEYVEYAAKNDSVKYYTIQNNKTTVVHSINSLVVEAMSGNENKENFKDHLNNWSQAIADKLVREEEKAQARIEAMGKSVKKGSLVQALISTDDQEYLYIIAKVEHIEYFDGESLKESLSLIHI